MPVISAEAANLSRARCSIQITIPFAARSAVHLPAWSPGESQLPNRAPPVRECSQVIAIAQPNVVADVNPRQRLPRTIQATASLHRPTLHHRVEPFLASQHQPSTVLLLESTFETNSPPSIVVDMPPPLFLTAVSQSGLGAVESSARIDEQLVSATWRQIDAPLPMIGFARAQPDRLSDARVINVEHAPTQSACRDLFAQRQTLPTTAANVTIDSPTIVVSSNAVSSEMRGRSRGILRIGQDSIAAARRVGNHRRDIDERNHGVAIDADCRRRALRAV